MTAMPWLADRVAAVDAFERSKNTGASPCCVFGERLSWTVTTTRTGYDVTGFVDPSKDFEVMKEDLDLISLADPLRIQSISMR